MISSSSLSTPPPLPAPAPSSISSSNSSNTTSSTISATSQMTNINSTPETSTPPQMKKVTSILRREMLSRQNNAPSTPISESSTSVSTPHPAPMLVQNEVKNQVESVAIKSNTTPLPPASASASSSQSEEKKSTSSVAEILSKARAGMKEKINKPQNPLPDTSKSDSQEEKIEVIPTDSMPPREELKRPGLSMEQIMERLVSSSSQSKVNEKKESEIENEQISSSQPQQEHEQSSPPEQDQSEQEQFKTDSSSTSNLSSNPSAQLLKQLVPSRVARKIVAKDQKK